MTKQEKLQCAISCLRIVWERAPGDVDVRTVASETGLPMPVCQLTLERLERAELVESDGEGRCRRAAAADETTAYAVLTRLCSTEPGDAFSGLFESGPGHLAFTGVVARLVWGQG